MERLRAEGLTAVQLDLDDPASIKEALRQTLILTGGTLDALFNNGAYGLPGAVEDLTRAALRAQLETNLLGWHDLTCRVIPIMRRQGHGRIVQNSSILGLMPLPYRGAYVASKYALEGLTDTLRLELAGSGIAGLPDRTRPHPLTLSGKRPPRLQGPDRRGHSVHREAYRRAEGRLLKEGPAQPFTLPPEAVLKWLIHALESARPRRVTTSPFPPTCSDS